MARDSAWKLLTVGSLLVVLIILMGTVGGAETTTDEAHFEVEITETNEPVAVGGMLVVNATITNTGDATGSQQIHLKDINDEIADSVAQPPLTLAPGESEQIVLTWEPDAADVGNGNVSVQSNDDFPRQTTTVRADPQFDVTVNGAPESITAGESLTATATVNNTGNETATSFVWLELGGSVIETTSIEVAPDEEVSVPLLWESSSGHVGDWTARVGVDGAPVTVPFTVGEPDTAEEENDSADTPDTETDESGADDAEDDRQKSATVNPSDTGQNTSLLFAGLLAFTALLGAGTFLLYRIR